MRFFRSTMPPFKKSMPLAWVVVVAAALPSYWLLVTIPAAIRRRMRFTQLCCTMCEYNPTGNTSDVCPECGTPIKSKDVPIKIA
jgi:uncharacterized paraquat-inducible protein A